jgi:hypothetical protein
MARKKRIEHVSRSFGGLFADCVVAEKFTWPAAAVEIPTSGKCAVGQTIRVVDMTTGTALVSGTDYDFLGTGGQIRAKGATYVGSVVAVVYF